MPSIHFKIRVLIVAEHPSDAASIREALSRNPEVEIVAVTSNDEFAQTVSASAPDLVFMAVSKKNSSHPGDISGTPHAGITPGFQLLALPISRLHNSQFRVFQSPSPNQTSMDSGSTEVHEPNPTSREDEITHLLKQARQFLGLESSVATITDLENKAAARDRLCIKSRGRILFLAVSDIRWIEGAGNYLRIHVESESHMVRETIADFEARLDPTRFVRIHRSAIVNLDAIREMRPWPTGEYVVTLKDGKELTLSRSYRNSVAHLIARGRKAALPLSSLKEAANKLPRPVRIYGS